MRCGTVAMGLLGFKFQNGFPKAVNNIGAASPRARATARRMPVKSARDATGRTTHRMVRQTGIPRASEASLKWEGTRRRASWVLIMMMGTMIKAYATAPEKPEKVPVGWTIRA